MPACVLAQCSFYVGSDPPKIFWIVLWMILALFMSSALPVYRFIRPKCEVHCRFWGGDDSAFGTLLVVVLSVQLFSSGFERDDLDLAVQTDAGCGVCGGKICAIQLPIQCLTLMSGTLAWQLYLYAGTTDELQYLAIAKYGFLQWLKFSIFKSCFNASCDFSADTFGDHVDAFMRID